MSERIMLKAGLQELCEQYEKDCRRRGLRESSIQQYMSRCRQFLKGLEDAGAENISDITAERVVRVCLSLKSNYYWEPIHTFLHSLAEAGYTDRDYSYVVPVNRRPQPKPKDQDPPEARLRLPG